jgi:hypothetical protein
MDSPVVLADTSRMQQSAIITPFVFPSSPPTFVSSPPVQQLGIGPIPANLVFQFRSNPPNYVTPFLQNPV